LHLNYKGKSAVSHSLALVIKQRLIKESGHLTVTPIPREDHLSSNNNNIAMESQDARISTISNTPTPTDEMVNLTSPDQDHPPNNNVTTMESQDEVENPIPLPQDLHSSDNHIPTDLHVSNTPYTTKEAVNLTSPPKQRRHCPVQRNPDFLWT
jgi:hypothetical protein